MQGWRIGWGGIGSREAVLDGVERAEGVQGVWGGLQGEEKSDGVWVD